jgi:hypothetical protein
MTHGVRRALDSRASIALAIVLAACGALAGCGSSASGSATTTSSALAAGSGTAANAGKLVAARVAAARCMRAQGINIPDPGIGAVSVLNTLRVLATYPKAKVQAAETACAGLIQKAFPNVTNLTPAQRAQRLQEGVAFSECMRSHGINFPDPRAAASNLSGYIQALQSLDLQSPALKAAAKTCRARTLHLAGR